MSRVDIPVTVLSRDGVAPGTQVTADAVNKHSFVNNDRTWIEVISTDGADQTVGLVFNTAQSQDGVALPDKEVTIPAGATIYIGAFYSPWYGQGGGLAYIDPSVSTTLKFRAYQVAAN